VGKIHPEGRLSHQIALELLAKKHRCSIEEFLKINPFTLIASKYIEHAHKLISVIDKLSVDALYAEHLRNGGTPIYTWEFRKLYT
jgi:hypothetical protein